MASALGCATPCLLSGTPERECLAILSTRQRQKATNTISNSKTIVFGICDVLPMFSRFVTLDWIRKKVMLPIAIEVLRIRHFSTSHFSANTCVEYCHVDA